MNEQDVKEIGNTMSNVNKSKRLVVWGRNEHILRSLNKININLRTTALAEKSYNFHELFQHNITNIFMDVSHIWHLTLSKSPL